LGVSGLTLRDNSGFQNNGMLTNGPTWAANQGKYALDFDTTNDYVNLNNVQYLTAGAPSAILWWERVTSSGVGYYSRFILRTDARALGIIRTDNVNYVGISLFNVSLGASKQFASAPSIASSVGIWRHFALQMLTGPASTANGDYALWVDGVTYPASAGGVGSYSDQTLSRIGWDGADDGPICNLDDIRIYNRALSAKEIRTLYTRRGIAYEMAPRRRSSSAVTTNRRRRIIIGGNR
jgi:hypothetical protein